MKIIERLSELSNHLKNNQDAIGTKIVQDIIGGIKKKKDKEQVKDINWDSHIK